MDDCKYCDARGDMARCENLSCSIHDDWITKELQARIARLERALRRACEEIVANRDENCPGEWGKTCKCPNDNIKDCADHWREWLLESEGE